MKVLHIIDSLDPGGAEKTALILVNILAANGVEVGLLTLIRSGSMTTELKPGINNINLSRRSKWNLFDMLRLRRICLDYDVLHVHMRHTLKYVWLVKVLLFVRKPIIFHDHSFYGHGKVSLLFRAILNQVTYCCVSREQYKWSIQMAKVPEKKVFQVQIPFAFTANFQAVAKKWHQDVLRIVLVSNARREKNIEYSIGLIQKLSISTQVTLDIYCQVVDSSYYEELVRLVGLKGLEGKVRFITDCTDIKPVLKNYDMAIHTSPSETGPLVLLEYLSEELPFLSYRTGAIAELLSGDLPEFFADKFDIDIWIKGIYAIRAADPFELRRRLQQAGRLHFSEEEINKKWIQIYETSLH